MFSVWLPLRAGYEKFAEGNINSLQESQAINEGSLNKQVLLSQGFLLAESILPWEALFRLC